jgi:rhodanese-related sulfurtransferase
MIKKSKHSDLLILDVRTEAEYSVTHLYDAVQLSYEDLEESISKIDEYKDNIIIVYCKSGARSKNSSQLLVDEGFSNVYNMEGGILAWIDAGYPVWSISHNVVVEDKGNIEITPIIIESCSCGCPEGDINDLQSDTEISVEINVLEENGTYKEVLIEYEIDDVSYETLMKRTLLFSSESHSNEANKYYELYYYEISTLDYDRRFYLLSYQNENTYYNLSITSILTPSDSDFYENVETVIIYQPKDKSVITTIDLIEINKNIRLSEYYQDIGKAAKKLVIEYRKSEDDILKKFSKNYQNINQEMKEFSDFIKKALYEYDLYIESGYGVILDAHIPPPPSGMPDPGGDISCELCTLAVDAGSVIICIALVAASLLNAAVWCIWAIDYFLITGSSFIVCQFAGFCP